MTPSDIPNHPTTCGKLFYTESCEIGRAVRSAELWGRQSCEVGVNIRSSKTAGYCHRGFYRNYEWLSVSGWDRIGICVDSAVSILDPSVYMIQLRFASIPRTNIEYQIPQNPVSIWDAYCMDIWENTGGNISVQTNSENACLTSSAWVWYTL